MRTRISLLILLLSAAFVFAQQKPPVAPVRPVTDDYFGTKITDPYRWMENTKDPEFQAWAKAQATYTQEVLQSLPGREKLLQRIAALDNAGIQITSFRSFGGRYFYLKTMPGDANRKLYVRDAKSGKETLLVDPEKLTKGSVHYSIDYISPSLDGKHVAYGISPGGSEESVLHIMDVDTEKELPETIDRAEFGVTGWLPDNKSFFYVRLNKLGPKDPPIAKYLRALNYLHKLGADPDKDEPVFGFGLSPEVKFADSDFAIVAYAPGTDWLGGIIAHGVRNEATIYYARLSELKGAKTPWRKLLDVDADVTNADIHGDDVYLLSHHNASRYQILRTSLKNPDAAHAQVVVPAGEAVLRDLKVAADALYVQQLDGGIGRVLRVPYDGGKPQQIPLPFEGAIDQLFADPREPGVIIRIESWTKPRVTLAYDPKSNKLTDLKLAPPPPVDFSQIESREVKARSADGTMVPLSIILKRGTPLNGTAPTYLNGYGSYGITQDPAFVPTLLAWLERGGIVAVGHIRGGGEYGEDWHNAGRMLTKQNTISDFIACAEYLIQNKYTSPAKLAIRGGSAGGITVGGAVTQRPELFAAAADLVPASDMLRMETTPNGPPNVPEFGSVKTEDGFKGLFLMSAYHHIKEGTPYPAVLVTTGINDPRVDSWEAAKMAARLQASTSSGKPVLLRIDYDAGHGMGSTKPQQEQLTADTYSFFLWQFGDPEFQPKPATNQKAAQ
jgi:prolyl oligopeptidase